MSPSRSSRPLRTLGAALWLAAAIGCSAPEPTPPGVEAELTALLQTADLEQPGASVARLRRFVERNRSYDIVPAAEREIESLRSLATGRYHQARELAREGDFDRAEAILIDLAIHLPDTPDGASAKQHLAFDFQLGKAQWLMVRQRWQESGEVARLLLKRDLSRTQQDQVEQILDNAGHVDAAYAQATRAQAQAACRHLSIYLETMAAEEGRYPSSLTLADVEAWDPMGSRSILRALSAIEDYQLTGRGYAFTAVSAGQEHRIHVVDGAIEN